MISPIFAQAATNQASGPGALIGLGLLFIALGVLCTCAWVYALFSAATRSDLSGGERVLWLALLISLTGLGNAALLPAQGTGTLNVIGQETRSRGRRPV